MSDYKLIYSVVNESFQSIGLFEFESGAEKHAKKLTEIHGGNFTVSGEALFSDK